MDKFSGRGPLPASSVTSVALGQPAKQCPFPFTRPLPPLPAERPPQPPPPPFPRPTAPPPPVGIPNGYRSGNSTHIGSVPRAGGVEKSSNSELFNGRTNPARDYCQQYQNTNEKRGTKRPISPQSITNCDGLRNAGIQKSELNPPGRKTGSEATKNDSLPNASNARNNQRNTYFSRTNGVESGSGRRTRFDSVSVDRVGRGSDSHFVQGNSDFRGIIRKSVAAYDGRRNSHGPETSCDQSRNSLRRNIPSDIPDLTLSSPEPKRYCFLEAREFYRAGGNIVVATSRLEALHDAFRKRIFGIFEEANKKNKKCDDESEESDSENEVRNSGQFSGEKKLRATDSGKNRKVDPNVINPDLMFNAHNRLNDGKACRCSHALRGYGIKHGHLVGEEEHKFQCKPLSNNAQDLFCYRMVLDPVINFVSPDSTKVRHAGREFAFAGFCIFSHQKLSKFPRAVTTRFNVEYVVRLEEMPTPGTFVVEDLNIFKRYMFSELMELVDWHLKAENFVADNDICDVFHFYPVFGRQTDDLMEIAPMSSVLYHILSAFHLLFSDSDIELLKCAPDLAFHEQVGALRGGLVAVPGRRPAAFRIDQIDDDASDVSRRDRDKHYPALVHFATRSVSAADPRTYREQKKLDQIRNVLETRPKSQITAEDKIRLHNQQKLVDDLSRNSKLKREVTVVVSSRGIYNTGLKSDIAQYGTLIPWVAFHFRYHISLDILEEKLQYKFSDRNLLELALTHPSYQLNIGTNADHIRNVLSNLGFRKAAYGQAGQIPKSGIKTLIHTMAQLGVEDEMASPIKNYERLEFLGDAVLEFLTSLRLFLIFQDIQEGGLATFRATLVQNSHLAVLGETYSLSHYLLISHGRELSSRKRITDKHAAANCFEAVCGAIYLDGGIRYVDEFFGRSLKVRLFNEDDHLAKVWMLPPSHVSMSAYPNGDRHLIPQHELLQRCVKFEELTGIPFTHIRLLANAFSSRQIHDNDITIGNNQRLEFLGDTVLQLIVSDYLFKHFPMHHEGHLSLLRSSLVSNKTQAFVCDELDMARFQIRDQSSKGIGFSDIKMKDKADLVEAYLGALYLDKGLTVCSAFCKVVFFPKLTDFISNQSWSDPKSRLQQCCLTLRSVDGSAPKLPEYKVINKVGPSNNRQYEVAVYFNGERLATATASNTKLAEEAAAEAALKNPTFLEDYKQQKSFARRAVAAQKANANRFASTSQRGPDAVGDRRPLRDN
ncbi:ribonuclease 3-like isoform X2 [Paramacrobiotus metropolitanus]|uniref:ribonuclease 3-like isoform X2 n=1 Tax=Paramacrobiotus metropolitanus TaxID=2943436 RepID=UPI002445FC5D|nr:ribonuclease 3-like isoform X2 [Paramacrobiotus metropolitanus]